MNEPTETTLQDALLDAALEERFSRQAPPDLSQRILAGPSAQPSASPNKHHWWLAAAVILVALGVVLATHGLSPDQTNPNLPANQTEPRPTQDRRKPPSGKRIYPKTLAAAIQLMRKATEVRIQLLLLNDGKLPAKLADSPAPPDLVLAQGPKEVDELTKPLLKLGDSKATLRRHPWPHRLRFMLADGRYIEAACMRKADQGVLLMIRGLGTVAGNDAFLETLAKRAFFRSVDMKTRVHQCIFEPADVHKAPDKSVFAKVTRMRAHGFTANDLRQLEHFPNLQKLDLRFSPAANDETALRRLAQQTRLRELKLSPDKLNQDCLVAIAEIQSLRKLQILAGLDKAWGHYRLTKSPHLNDLAAITLSRLRNLQTLVLPGTSISDQGLTELGRLAKLQLLTLSGAGRLTGIGFQAFKKHQHLCEVYLNGCTGLTDDGLAELAQLPNLEELYLAGARRGRLTGKATAAGLRRLGSAPKLRRLNLGSWFVVQFSLRGWRDALQAVSHNPSMRWLSLSDCAGVSFEALSFLRVAPLTVLDLSGTFSEYRYPDTVSDRVPHISKKQYAQLCKWLPSLQAMGTK